jgi:hypothetical protein
VDKEKQKAYAFIEAFFLTRLRMCVQENSTSLLTLLLDFNLLSCETVFERIGKSMNEIFSRKEIETMEESNAMYEFKPGDLVWFEPGLGFPLPGEIQEVHKAAQIVIVTAYIDGKVRNVNLLLSGSLGFWGEVLVVFIIIASANGRETAENDILIAGKLIGKENSSNKRGEKWRKSYKNSMEKKRK